MNHSSENKKMKQLIPIIFFGILSMSAQPIQLSEGTSNSGVHYRPYTLAILSSSAFFIFSLLLFLFALILYILKPTSKEEPKQFPIGWRFLLPELVRMLMKIFLNSNTVDTGNYRNTLSCRIVVGTSCCTKFRNNFK